MAEVDFLSVLHKSTQRDYLARVNDPEFPKAKAAELAKKFDFDYWDGDRRVCYGGYRYMEGRWEKVARAMVEHYQLPENAKILDIGCGKGFLLYDFLKVLPNASIYGIDISKYALDNSKEEIRNQITLGNATSLPWLDNYFDFVYSINTLHCLHSRELDKALR
ncbi:class I SAM-dependent methyltransferase, partial [Synechococcus sp. AH-558-M21]|nr:class I SAM-dependent methyltransferase [Synechococcus sp. AH-558-M21]